MIKIKKFQYKKLFVSSIFWKILAVNLIAPIALFIGIISFDNYQKGLIDSQFEYMKSHTNLISTAIAESGIEKSYVEDKNSITGTTTTYWLRSSTTRRILRKSVDKGSIRYRVFDKSGKKIADTNDFLENKIENTIVKNDKEDFITKLIGLYNSFNKKNINENNIEKYVEKENETAKDFREVIQSSKRNRPINMVRFTNDYSKILTVAVPVKTYNKNAGVVLASLDAKKVEETLKDVRKTIFKVFCIVFILTIILSLYLFITIALPLVKLSDVADNIKTSKNREYDELKNLVKRKDEIGRLSVAFKAMVNSLWYRIESMERFAADVSHELKNPLTSIKSAIETFEIIKNDQKKEQLLDIVKNDINRADRIITDIANLSKIEAEITRERMKDVCIYDCLKNIVQTYNISHSEKKIKFIMGVGEESYKNITIGANENKLIQVFDNIISNAVSFAPEKSTIEIEIKKENNSVIIDIIDEGQGIKIGEEEKIFERFYSDRISEDGSLATNHSGLGLSIVKKIVQQMRGTITASNNIKDGKVKGAKFTIKFTIEE